MITYNLCLHTTCVCWYVTYVDIQLMLTLTYVDIQLMLTCNLCWHTTYVDIQLMLTCNTFVSRHNQHLCRHVTYVDMWLMLTYDSYVDRWLMLTCYLCWRDFCPHASFIYVEHTVYLSCSSLCRMHYLHINDYNYDDNMPFIWHTNLDYMYILKFFSCFIVDRPKK